MGIRDTLFGSSPKIETPKLEDFLPFIQAQADFNRVDQSTPFGGIRYNTTTPEAMPWDEWSAQNPVTTSEGFWKNEGKDNQTWMPGTSTGGTRGGYDQYVTDFQANNPGETTAESYFSPEIQNIFTQQFQPDSYQHYADDYMDESRRLLNPVYDRQLENFQQGMANRGQPVGGELYTDSYGDLMDAQNRGWESAAFQAKNAGEQARLQDWNRLMSAMGNSSVPVPQVDVMSPANMAMNAQVGNAQTRSNDNSNMWNTLAGLGGAYVTGGMMGDSPFWMKS